MEVKNIYNKIIPYIKTYGLIKGISYAKKQYKIHKNAKKEFVNLLPVLEKKLMPIILKYKNNSVPAFNGSQKNIFFFWWDGFDSAPDIVKKCYEKIKLYYQDFKLIIIDKNNYSIAEIDDYLVNLFLSKKITIQTFSDILRLKLISKFGGVWIDSTVLLINKFNLINDLNKYSFVSCIENDTSKFYNFNGIVTSWSSFFIGGSKNNPIFLCTYNLYLEYLKSNNNNINYFLTDCFLLLCKKNKVGNGLLDIYKEVNVPCPTSYISNNLTKKLNQKQISQMTIQKLNWRINFKNFKKDTYASYCYKGEL